MPDLQNGDDMTHLESHISQQNLRLIRLSKQINDFIAATPALLDSIGKTAESKTEQASAAAIAGLSTQVGNIAREIAGNAAAATAAQAKVEAARWQAGALAVGVLVGGIAAAVLTTGFFKIKLTDAQSKVTAIESSTADVVAAATHKLNNELISVRAAAGWAATESGVQVSNCKVPGWKIEKYTNGTSICITKPAEKNLIGKNEDAVWFWIKALPPEKLKK